MKCLILLLLPVIVLAQADFGPLRLDDARGELFFYPVLYFNDAGNSYVTWATQTSAFVGAYGQEVNAAGEWVGVNDVYQQANMGVTQCPPELALREFSGGESMEMIIHS
jgi:hypothetical protein